MKPKTTVFLLVLALIVILILALVFPTNTFLLISAISSSFIFLMLAYVILKNKDAVPENKDDQMPLP